MNPSGARRGVGDLALALGVLAASFGMAIAGDPPPVMRLVSLAAIAFAPGYLCLAALYPARGELDRAERAVGSAAISIAADILIGLALNQAPLGIGAPVFTGTLFATGLVLAATAAYRRRGRGMPGKGRMVRRYPVSWLVGVGVAGVLLAGLYAVALFPPPQPRAPTTQFFLIPAGGDLADRPATLCASEPVTVTVGVVNLEDRPMAYEVHRQIGTGASARIAALRLAPGDRWEMPYTFSVFELSGPQKLSFLLFKRADMDAPYRQVYLWLQP